MDQPDLDSQSHEAALRGLARLNAWSGSDRILWRPLAALAKNNNGKPLRVLDVATGAGDLPVKLWLRAKQAGIPVEISACDISPTALESGRNRAREAGANVNFFAFNAVRDPIPPEYDVIVSSLFFHHLDREQAVQLLRNMAAAARMSVCINDLERRSAGWAIAWLGSRILTRSPIVHLDALLSVEAAFTIPEITRIAEEAGMNPITISCRWPFRFLLVWKNE